jgi:hypothetical protein
VKRLWLRTRLWIRCSIALALIGSLASCAGTRAVIVPPNEPVQVAEDAQVRVYVNTKEGRVKSQNKVTIREGQWIVSDPGQ